jgi:hypothetical protein
MPQHADFAAILALYVAASCATAGAQEIVQPAIKDATQQAQQTTPIMTLSPAPTVTSWGPARGNVDRGLVTIVGSGFDPATVAVRHGGTALTLVEKTSTRVVARLGNWSGGSAYLERLTVNNRYSHVRVLSEQYEVRPRWPSQAPRFLEGVRLGGGRAWNSVYERPYRVRLLGMPGDEIVGRELRQASSGRCAFATWRTPMRIGDSTAASYFTADPSPAAPIPVRDDPETFESGGRGSQELHLREFWIGTFQSNAGATCDVEVRMLVRYADEPGDVRAVDMVLRGLPSPSARKKLIVTDTHAMLTSKLFRIEPNLFNTPFKCRIESDGGAFRQALDWIVTGSKCEHVVFFNNMAWRSGFQFLAWNWSGPQPPTGVTAEPSPRCHIDRYDAEYSRMKVWMGWERRLDDRSTDVIRSIKMECLPPGTQGATDAPNVVRARLDSVELEVPETASGWRDAMTL